MTRNRDSEIRAKRSFVGIYRGALVCVAAIVIGGILVSVPRDKEPAGVAAASHPARKINVVLFLIDTLRADRVGAYGYARRPTTPNIDALAREGVLFEQAGAPAPWTLPSVASLLTSTFPCEHQVLDNRRKLGEEHAPLAARLKQLGYGTAGLYANALVGPFFGLDRGFEEYQPLGEDSDGEIRRMAGKRLQQPFFLYIHSIEPHTPYLYAPPSLEGFRELSHEVRLDIQRRYLEYRNATRVDFGAKRPLGSTDNTAEQRWLLAEMNSVAADYNELYDAAVVAADRLVGTLVATLKAGGVWDDTLLIVLSDHGEEMYEHGGWLHDQSAYEELLHVPLVMRFPGNEFAGERVKEPMSLVDVLPTLAEYLGEPRIATETRGRSLMPAIRGANVAPEGELRIVGMRWNTKKYFKPWKESRGDINVVVRKGAWKGIWNVEPRTLELYNLETDPGERRDASVDQTELADRMRRAAEGWREDCGKLGTSESRPAAEPDEETLENLRRLGYVD